MDYSVATYAFGLQPTPTPIVTVQASQPEPDHRLLHLSLHLPHTSTPASLPPHNTCRNSGFALSVCRNAVPILPRT